MREPLEQFRAEIDQFMKGHPQSPLDRREKRAFTGLVYYDFNPDLVFETAVHLLDDEAPIVMGTSTGAEQAYWRWGRFAFVVGGASVELTIYSDAAGESLFLPFKDVTNGGETYGAGRYMDNHRPGIALLSGDRVCVDFNYAYNPYCAYSSLYSCPLPPRENWLSVRIEAGEKVPSER